MSETITKDILFYKILPCLSYYDLYFVQFISKECRRYGVEKFHSFFVRTISMYWHANTSTIQFCAFHLFVFQTGYGLPHQTEGFKSYMTATDAFKHLYLSKKSLQEIREQSTHWNEHDRRRPYSHTLENTESPDQLLTSIYNVKHGYSNSRVVMPEPILSSRSHTVYPVIVLLYYWLGVNRSVSLMNQTRQTNRESVFGYVRRKRKEPEFEDVIIMTPPIQKNKSQRTLQKERFNQTHIRPPEYTVFNDDPP